MSEEMQALSPVPERATLSTGREVIYEDLRTRQFFKLLRVLTNGAAPVFNDPDMFRIGKDTDWKEWGQKFLALILIALPNAEDEALDFVRSMVRPVGLIDPKDRLSGLTNDDQLKNENLWRELYGDLVNPEIDDTVTLLEGIVRRESKDIVALGRRIGSMMKIAQKTGQLSDRENKTAPSKSSTPDSVTSVEDLARQLASESLPSTNDQRFPDPNSSGVSVGPSI